MTKQAKIKDILKNLAHQKWTETKAIAPIAATLALAIIPTLEYAEGKIGAITIIARFMSAPIIVSLNALSNSNPITYNIVAYQD